MTVLRYASTTAIDSAGASFIHGLQDINGAAAVPTEWSFALSTGCASFQSNIYLVTLNSSVIRIALSSTSTGTASVFCSIPHAIIR